MTGVNPLKRKRRARRGFTLVETLIVLMTFGILVSLISDIFVQTTSFGRQIVTRAKLQADARNAVEAIARAVRVSNIDYASWGGTLPSGGGGGPGPSFSCGFGTDIDGTHCRGYITSTSATTWSVPSDWNSSDNSIEVIGAGGNGADAVSASTPGGGGGGGEYRKAINVILTAGSVVDIEVPSGGAGSSADGAWVKNNSGIKVIEAKNGDNASGITAGLGGTGGTGGSGNNGGNGGNTTDASNSAGAGGGGGGSAGPDGGGKNGGTAQGTTSRGGGGGGGSNGGLSSAGGSSSGSTGGTGGNGNDGTGGGSSGGGAATAEKGAGGGGGNNATGSTNAPGGSGSSESLWDTNVGPSGGGGGAGAASGSAGTGSRNGGAGGNYGGGGGGAGYSGTGSVGTGGAGGQGIIVITYAPETAPAEPSSGSSELRLTNPITGLSSRIKLDSTDSGCYSDAESFPCIVVSTDGGAVWTPLSPKGSKIDALYFYAAPDKDPFLYDSDTGTYDSNSQPIITVVATFHALAGRPKDEWSFTIQTTMTPRLYLR